MVILRGEIFDNICMKIGIAKRAHPGSHYLSKRELMQLGSWIDIAQSRLNTLGSQRKADEDGSDVSR